MPVHFKNKNLRRESGVVLITGLIFLTILTMLVLSALRSDTLEERMASNSRNRQVAIQAAEAILRDAEDNLFSGTEDRIYISKFNSGNQTALANGFYRAPATGSTPRWKTIDWNSSTATLTFAASETSLYGVESPPKYIIEITKPPTRVNSTVACEKGIATITARGVGRDSSTFFIQTMYRYQSNRPSDGC